MDFGFGINIIEGECMVVFIDGLAGDFAPQNFGENVVGIIFHVIVLFCCFLLLFAMSFAKITENEERFNEKRIKMKKIWMALVCGVWWATGVAAANLYQVANVPIAAEVGTAMEARDIAIANGQVDAFWVLLRKMVQSDDLTKLPLVGQDEVVNFVQNVSLSDEKTTATKYMASMTVTFKPRAVQDFLTENQVPFLVQAPPTALVVPVYRHGADVWLVEADSPVYTALRNVVSANGLFEWVLPESDPDTAEMIRAAWSAPESDLWRDILSGVGVGRVFLWEVIQEHRDSLLICVPRFLTNMDNISNEVKTFWKYSLLRNQSAWDYYLEENRIYGDTQFTRFYMDLKDKSSSAQIIGEIKSLWKNRDVIIVEGKESRLGVGNDLFIDSNSVRRIICPAENAYCYYDRILCETKKLGRDYLFIIALGPTATVLAYDLSREGFQAIDMGHIDIEYEWFLRQSSSKIAIKGKYVNECHTRGGVVDDGVYLSQIIAIVD